MLIVNFFTKSSSIFLSSAINQSTAQNSSNEMLGCLQWSGNRGVHNQGSHMLPLLLRGKT